MVMLPEEKASFWWNLSKSQGDVKLLSYYTLQLIVGETGQHLKGKNGDQGGIVQE